MAQYITSLTYSIDLTLLVSVEALLGRGEHAEAGKKLPESDQVGFQGELEYFLKNEAQVKAFELLQRSVSFSKRDPWGLTFPSEGIFLCNDAEDLSVELPSDHELYANRPVNSAAKIRIDAQGITWTEFRLPSSSDAAFLWEKAEEVARKILAIVQEMIKIDNNLPDGWEFESDLKVVLEEMSVFKRLSWWEKSLGARSKNEATRIPKPKKIKSFRK